MAKTNPHADLEFCPRSATCKNYCPCICDEWCYYQPLEEEEKPIDTTPTDAKKKREILMMAQLGLYDKSDDIINVAKDALNWADSHPKDKNV